MNFPVSEDEQRSFLFAASIGAIAVHELPHCLFATRRMFVFRGLTGQPCLAVWSMAVARILGARAMGAGFDFASWHDDQQNCATWTDGAGCRCEVDP